MINLPMPLTPSALLCCAGLTSGAERLGAQCVELAAHGDLERIEKLAREAEHLRRQKGDWLGCAAALLRLADYCRDIGKLGPALRYCQSAQRIYRRHSYVPEQRHNEAVSSYALGLIHQLLGDEQRAIEQYEHALVLFQRAQKRWRLSRESDRDQQCEVILRWLGRLITYVSDVRSRGGTTAVWYSFVVCPWPATLHHADHHPADLQVQEHTPAQELRIGKRAFDLHPTGKSPLTLRRDVDYYVVETPTQGAEDLALQPGDCVLVERPRGVLPDDDALVEEGTDAPFWRFERHPDGSLHVVPPGLAPKPQVIGDLDQHLEGIILGTLRPAEGDRAQ